MHIYRLWGASLLILSGFVFCGPAAAGNYNDPCAGKQGKKLVECLGENNTTASGRDNHGAAGTTMHALDADDERLRRRERGINLLCASGCATATSGAIAKVRPDSRAGTSLLRCNLR